MKGLPQHKQFINESAHNERAIVLLSTELQKFAFNTRRRLLKSSSEKKIICLSNLACMT